MAEPNRLGFSFQARHESITLALLTGLAIALFVAVSGLSRLYHSQLDSLALRWKSRGIADLQARRFDSAVNDFRASLLYSRDSATTQLSLAEALLGLGKTDEAYAYLINLWDREPENGDVNLNLARIAASKGETSKALRFYHNAIYATWAGDQEHASRNARFELVEYLLRTGAKTQAQAELLALAASLTDHSHEQERLGSSFLRAGDPQHALVAFKFALVQDRHNQSALAGAGIAAFQLGLYPAAKHYLLQAIAITPKDQQSADWLNKTNTVLALDPYRRQISDIERDNIALHAFAIAGARLQACDSQPDAIKSNWQGLEEQWNKSKPQMTPRRMRANPDLVNTAMELAIGIETETTGLCGAPNESDSALLLIANLHEED